MSMQPITIEDVRAYLMTCDENLVCKLVGILQRSRMYKNSASYIVGECEKSEEIPSDSPLVISLTQLLKQNEKTWPQVMKVGEEVAQERNLNVKRLYE